jgi:hypothetical protein
MIVLLPLEAKLMNSAAKKPAKFDDDFTFLLKRQYIACCLRQTTCFSLLEWDNYILSIQKKFNETTFFILCRENIISLIGFLVSWRGRRPLGNSFVCSIYFSHKKFVRHSH